MTETIIMEARFFLISIFSGFVVFMAYDGFRILRRVIKHNNAIVAIEDILFGIITGLEMFKVILRHNNGVIRGFLVVAYGIGMYLYYKLFSRAFVNTMSYLINKIKLTILFPFRLIIRVTKFILKGFKKVINKGKSGKKQPKIVD